MTHYQIFATGLRVLALWLGLATVGYIATESFTLDAHFKANLDTVFMYLVPASLLAVAVLAWFFPQAVAYKLIPRTRFDNHLTLNLHEVARACTALIGLWTFTRALPHVLWYVTFFSLSDGSSAGFGQLSTGGKTSFLIHCFEILLSLALMLRAADFARLLVPKVKA